MPESATQLSLSAGDRVVYPNQGVCLVSGVEIKEVAGQRLTFVTMKREEDGALVMVPEAKIRTVGLRRIASTKDVTKVIAFLADETDKADLDWKQRARVNADRMSHGGVSGLAEVVKGLQVLSELRPLPTKERELYDTARHLLVREIAASLNIADCDAEDAVDIVIFPVGRERPKRTVAEFKPNSEHGESLEGGEDLLDDLDSAALDLPLDEIEAPSSETAEDETAARTPDEEATPARRKQARTSKAKKPSRVAKTVSKAKSKTKPKVTKKRK